MLLRNPMSPALALLLSLTVVTGCSRGHISTADGEKSDHAMWSRVGKELAASASKLDIKSVVIVRQDIPKGSSLGPWQDLMEASLRTSLGRAREISVVALPTPPEPKEPAAYAQYNPRRRLDAQVLADAVKQHPSASLVVSLIGEPTAATPGKCPPIVCFSFDGSSNLAKQIRSGVVAAAVAPRHTAPAEATKDWFDLRYTVVTKDNLSAWAR